MPARNQTYRPTAVGSLLTAHSSQAEIFAFSAKEKDTETGLSYFGARYYSSDLSIWLSVDPMSDKYPSLSSYVYCANNPVKLVDPNGEEILIEWKNSVYRYEQNGSLTLVNGNPLSDRQRNRFVERARKSLNKINKTTEGKRMITNLQDSETQYTIRAGASGYERKEPNTITWNRFGTRLPVAGSPFGEANGTIDLAHELSHAFDDERGWTDQSPWNGDLKKSEWVACYRENLIRKELGLPYRTYYSLQTSSEGHFLGGSSSSLLQNGVPYLPFNIKSYEF